MFMEEEGSRSCCLLCRIVGPILQGVRPPAFHRLCPLLRKKAEEFGRAVSSDGDPLIGKWAQAHPPFKLCLTNPLTSLLRSRIFSFGTPCGRDRKVFGRTQAHITYANISTFDQCRRDGWDPPRTGTELDNGQVGSREIVCGGNDLRTRRRGAVRRSCDLDTLDTVDSDGEHERTACLGDVYG